MKILDMFGNIRGIGGIYADVTEPVIKSLDNLKSYQFPDFKDEKGLPPFRKYQESHPDVFILGTSFGVHDLFITQPWNMQDALMAMIDHPAEVKAFQQRMADWAVDLSVRNLYAGADGILIYDDYGYPKRTMISVDMWKEFTLPHRKRIIAAIHEEGGVTMLHSCRFQMPLLSYYPEIELAMAYPQFGDRLTFVTGIDIQLGELMSPDQMRGDIIKNFQIGKTKNRFILGTTHELQFTMPDENMNAIFQTVKEIQQSIHN